MVPKVHIFQGLCPSGGGANLPRVKIISCINRRKGALFGATISHDKVTTLAGSQQHLLIQWYGRGNREVYPRQGSQAVRPWQLQVLTRYVWGSPWPEGGPGARRCCGP